MRKIYLMCGFLGAGKTTVAKQMVSDLQNTILLNVDDITAEKHTPEQLRESWDDCFMAAYEYCWEVIKATPDKDFILDVGFWTKQSRQDAEQRASKLDNTSSELVWVVAEPDVMKERVQLRGSPMSKEHILHWDEIYAKFEEPTHEDATIVYTGKIPL